MPSGLASDEASLEGGDEGEPLAEYLYQHRVADLLERVSLSLLSQLPDDPVEAALESLRKATRHSRAPQLVKTLSDIPPGTRRVLLLCDFGTAAGSFAGVEADAFLRRCAKTAQRIQGQASVIIAGYYGSSPPAPGPGRDAFSLRSRQAKLQQSIEPRTTVTFVELDLGDSRGPSGWRAWEDRVVDAAKRGIVLLENLWFAAPQQAEELTRSLARVSDAVLVDSFACAVLPPTHTGAALPRVAEQACLGPHADDEFNALLRCGCAPALPCVASFGGMEPLTGLRAEALQQLVLICDEVMLAGRPGLLLLKHQRGLAVGVGFSHEEDGAMGEALHTAERLGRRLTPPDDLLAVLPSAGDGSGAALRPGAGSGGGRRVRREADLLSSAAGNDIPEGARVLDIGPQTQAAWSERLAAAATLIMVGALGDLSEVSARWAEAAPPQKQGRLLACCTVQVMVRLAELRSGAQRPPAALVVGGDLFALAEAYNASATTPAPAGPGAAGAQRLGLDAVTASRAEAALQFLVGTEQPALAAFAK